MYLQFEEQKLCFKIWCGYDNKSEIRNRFFDIIMTTKQNIFTDEEIHKPNRFRPGEYMTVAVVEPDLLFGTEIVDIQAVVSKLHQYEHLIDLCCEKYEKEYCDSLK